MRKIVFGNKERRGEIKVAVGGKDLKVRIFADSSGQVASYVRLCLLTAAAETAACRAMMPIPLADGVGAGIVGIGGLYKLRRRSCSVLEQLIACRI